jgi:hypothetical protein
MIRTKRTRNHFFDLDVAPKKRLIIKYGNDLSSPLSNEYTLYRNEILKLICSFLTWKEMISFCMINKKTYSKICALNDEKLFFIKHLSNFVDSFVKSLPKDDNEQEIEDNRLCMLMTLHKTRIFIAGKIQSVKKLSELEDDTTLGYQKIEEKSKFEAFYRSFISSGSINILTLMDENQYLDNSFDRSISMEIYPPKLFSFTERSKDERIIIKIASNNRTDGKICMAAYIMTESSYIGTSLDIMPAEFIRAVEICQTITGTDIWIYPVFERLNNLMELDAESEEILLSILLKYAQIPLELNHYTLHMEDCDAENGQIELLDISAEDLEYDEKTVGFESEFVNFMKAYASNGVWKDRELVDATFNWINHVYCSLVDPRDIPFPQLEASNHLLLDALATSISEKKSSSFYYNGSCILESSFKYHFGACNLKFDVTFSQFGYKVCLHVLDRMTATIMFKDGSKTGKYMLVDSCSSDEPKFDHELFDSIREAFPIEGNNQFISTIILWLACSVDLRLAPKCQHTIRLQNNNENRFPLSILEQCIQELSKSEQEAL